MTPLDHTLAQHQPGGMCLPALTLVPRSGIGCLAVLCVCHWTRCVNVVVWLHCLFAHTHRALQWQIHNQLTHTVTVCWIVQKHTRRPPYVVTMEACNQLFEACQALPTAGTDMPRTPSSAQCVPLPSSLHCSADALLSFGKARSRLCTLWHVSLSPTPATHDAGTATLCCLLCPARASRSGSKHRAKPWRIHRCSRQTWWPLRATATARPLSHRAQQSAPRRSLPPGPPTLKPCHIERRSAQAANSSSMPTHSLCSSRQGESRHSLPQDCVVAVVVVPGAYRGVAACCSRSCGTILTLCQASVTTLWRKIERSRKADVCHTTTTALTTPVTAPLHQLRLVLAGLHGVRRGQ